MTPSKFAIEIEKIVAAEEDFNYIDAICYYCETNNIEVESVSKLISKPLKERLKWDATRLNFMKPTSFTLLGCSSCPPVVFLVEFHQFRNSSIHWFYMLGVEEHR